VTVLCKKYIREKTGKSKEVTREKVREKKENSA